jgi:hypothetical protein
MENAWRDGKVKDTIMWSKIALFKTEFLRPFSDSPSTFRKERSMLAQALIKNGQHAEAQEELLKGLDYVLRRFKYLPSSDESYDIDKWLTRQAERIGDQLYELRVTVPNDDYVWVKDNVLSKMRACAIIKTNYFGYYDGRNGTCYRVNPYPTENVLRYVRVAENRANGR